MYRFRVFLLGAGLMTFSLQACSQPATPEAFTADVRQAAQRALEPDGQVLDVRLVPTTLGDTRVVLKLRSRLPDAAQRADQAAAQALFGHVAHLVFDTTVEGKTATSQGVICPGTPMPTDYPGGPKPSGLSGAKIVLNPGHGWTRYDSGSWQLQRGLVDISTSPPVYVQEDLNNLDEAIAVNARLSAAGALVTSVRSLDKNAGNGSSGHPIWQEAAKHHLERIGAASGIWDSARTLRDADCQEDKDVRSRPLYANALGADVLIGLHSNATTQDWELARGTRVYYTTDNALAGTPGTQIAESRLLANALGEEVVSAIRAARPELNWPDAQIIGSSDYGETRFAKMPAVIIEMGFHTNSIDGPALSQDSFRQAVALGVLKGLGRYLGQGPPFPDLSFPAAPILTAPGTAASTEVSSASPITFSWQGVTGAVRYGLYISKYPYGNTNLVYSNEQISGATSLSLAASAFQVPGENRYRWNMTAFHGPGEDDNGSFSPGLVFSLKDEPVLAPPVVPAFLTAAMSSEGRMLLAWPEVSAAKSYSFSATFDGQGVSVVGAAPAHSGVLGAAVVALDKSLSIGSPEGKAVCFQVLANNAAGTSTPTLPTCVAYTFYTDPGKTQTLHSGGSSPAQLLLRKF